MSRYFILMRTILVIAAILLWVGVGRPSSPSSSDQNLLANANFVASGRSMPTGWSVRSLPGCGFRYAVLKDGAVGEFEIINDEAVESSLQQSVHNLKPGWYLFTADIKTETVGSAGSPPELFVKSATLPIHNRAHTLGWNDDWQKLHLTFSAGSRISDVVVGFGLGTWGRPNTGKLLIRNPTLIPTTPEQFRTARRLPRAKKLRWALSLTQEEFAARYHIPLGTLRDWEQGRCEPDQPARAYLTVIAHDPEGVQRALAGKHR